MVNGSLIKIDLPLLGREEAGDCLQESRLTCTVGPQDGYKLLGLDLQGHGSDRLEPVVKNADVRDLEHGPFFRPRRAEGPQVSAN